MPEDTSLKRQRRAFVRNTLRAFTSLKRQRRGCFGRPLLALQARVLRPRPSGLHHPRSGISDPPSGIRPGTTSPHGRPRAGRSGLPALGGESHGRSRRALGSLRGIAVGLGLLGVGLVGLFLLLVLLLLVLLLLGRG